MNRHERIERTQVHEKWRGVVQLDVERARIRSADCNRIGGRSRVVALCFSVGLSSANVVKLILVLRLRLAECTQPRPDEIAGGDRVAIAPTNIGSQMERVR